jgi:hypothetical protein
LSELLARNATEGTVSIRFERPAGYFRAAAIEGTCHQVVVCRDTHIGQIVGMGSRSIRLRFVAGQPRPVGYLSSLRLDRAARQQGLVARGFQFFRQLDGDGQADFHVTTIAVGNKPAERTLLHARVGLPTYQPIGTLRTHAISLRRYRSKNSSRWHVRPARLDDLPNLVDWLHDLGQTQPLYPCYQLLDFTGSPRTFCDLRPEDIYLAFDGPQLVGSLALWNQSGFKQHIVHQYPGWLGLVRPMSNWIARYMGDPELPPIGSVLHSLYAGAIAIRDHDPRCLEALLQRCANDYAQNPTRVLIGLDTRSPLLPALEGRTSHRYDTGVYLVGWDRSRFPVFESHPPFYLELGCL